MGDANIRELARLHGPNGYGFPDMGSQKAGNLTIFRLGTDQLFPGNQGLGDFRIKKWRDACSGITIETYMGGRRAYPAQLGDVSAHLFHSFLLGCDIYGAIDVGNWQPAKWKDKNRNFSLATVLHIKIALVRIPQRKNGWSVFFRQISQQDMEAFGGAAIIYAVGAEKYSFFHLHGAGDKASGGSGNFVEGFQQIFHLGIKMPKLLATVKSGAGGRLFPKIFIC